MLGADLEVYLGHMGGPYWSRKDAAAWSVIKGGLEAGETPLRAALREFREETGIAAPSVDYRLLGEFTQPSRKIVTVFVAQIDDLPVALCGNTFDIEWPPRSGHLQSFPEIDRGGWFGLEVARSKLLRGLVPVIDALAFLRPAQGPRDIPPH
ncbi:NUDIX domain-containing protein [Lacisediminihabitans sp. G11-30]|uniref:NUDIX domain-containing protein n=2 Tax=Lacisediminihabitans changchengi TaxID=2787634 RepID=A0A934SM53_9MICO|nr:NUDIX domain-containing protein [Lacisediminihabitans changchengi]MBK4347921.1 NUDIX domain-containing protein [Lacisediminihabitans changchengi]